MYQAFAIVQATVAGYLAYVGTLANPLLAASGTNIIMANIVAGLAAVQIAMIAAAKPPSYDMGGYSQAKGIYQTGDIGEWHIPTPSGEKIPVKMSGVSGQQQKPSVVKIILENPVFQDLETLNQTMAQIAAVVTSQLAPGAVVQSYKDGEEIRDLVRSGA